MHEFAALHGLCYNRRIKPRRFPDAAEPAPYHRPADDGSQDGLAAALELLSRPDVRTVPLAGGDTLIGSGDPTIEAVVDLQALGLTEISLDPNLGALSAQAMVTRAQLASLKAPAAPAGSHAAKASPLGIIAAGAQRWGGNVQRNRATLGGALATAAPNDPLRGRPAGQRRARPALHEFGIPDRPPGRVHPRPRPAPGRARADHRCGRAAAAGPVDRLRVGRCGAHACGRPYRGRRRHGLRGLWPLHHVRLALGGVAPHPVRLPEVEALLADQPLTSELIAAAAARAAESVHPTGDFRGSAEYRKAMAGVLAERALQQAWERAA